MRIVAWLPCALAVGVLASACVYASEPPTADSSGKSAQSSSDDGTDPSMADDPGGDASFSATDSGTKSGGKDAASGADGSMQGNDASTNAPTWTTIYASYFGSGSVGHCGDSGCHQSSRGGFKCGSDKSTCYSGLVSAAYIDTSNGSSSALIDPSQSCLSWFGGNMPGGSNAQAKTDITAWVQAGAQND